MSVEVGNVNHFWSLTTRWGGGSATVKQACRMVCRPLKFPGRTYSLQNRAIKVAKSRAPLSIVCRHFAYGIDRSSTSSSSETEGRIDIEGLFMHLMSGPWRRKTSESTCQHGLCLTAVSGEPTQSLLETPSNDFPQLAPSSKHAGPCMAAPGADNAPLQFQILPSSRTCGRTFCTVDHADVYNSFFDTNIASFGYFIGLKLVEHHLRSKPAEFPSLKKLEQRVSCISPCELLRAVGCGESMHHACHVFQSSYYRSR